MRIAAVAVGIVVFSYWAFGRAVDQELATGATTFAEDKGQGNGTVSFRGVSRPESGWGAAPSANYQGKTARWWARRAVQARKDANKRQTTINRLRGELRSRTIGPTLAIRLVFGAHAQEALRVAWCESRWWPGASNGQYQGLFQMGTFARGRYGHSSDALGQAQAAYRYFVDSGRDWSPWGCKP